MHNPSISVVMSVYNNADTLPTALESILSQQGVELEFIAIDDGSTDGSGDILDETAARDSRLKTVHRQNEGLTQALAAGCSMASAPWIARQDADDFSLPGRLRTQLDRTQQSDSPVLISCGAKWRTPEGAEMFSSLPPAEPGALRRRLLVEGQSVCAHGTAFFSKTAYDQVGGYRPEFYYAQDLDLFTRLARIGPVEAIPTVLYVCTFSPHSISARAAYVQKQFRALICRSDDAALQEAATLSRKIREGVVKKKDPFAGYYFMGSCLRKNDPKAAAGYFRKALWWRPWSVQTMFRLMQCAGVTR